MESSSGSKRPEGLASRFFLMSFWGRLSGDGDAIGIATRLRLSREFVAMLRHHDFRPSEAAILRRRSGDGDAIGIDLVQNNIIRISTSIFDEFEVVI